MTTLKIKDGKSLEAFLKIVAEESVTNALKNLKEIGKNSSRVIKEEDDIFGNKPEPTQQNTQPTPQQKMPAEEIPHTITLDSIVNKLNIIRSGKSLKRDDLVQGELTDYFNKLEDAEKKSLYAFLKSIGAIMGGSVEGETALSPKEMGALSPQEKKQQQPIQQAEKPQSKVSVSQEPQKVRTSSSENEDDSPPIRVKYSNNETLRRNVKKLIV